MAGNINNVFNLYIIGNYLNNTTWNLKYNQWHAFPIFLNVQSYLFFCPVSKIMFEFSDV